METKRNDEVVIQCSRCKRVDSAGMDFYCVVKMYLCEDCADDIYKGMDEEVKTE